MKKIRMISLFAFCTLIISVTIAQTVTVDGYAFLELQAKHDSIKVLFERTAPTSLYYTTYTDSGGYYNFAMEKGVYKITYTIQGYISNTITDQPFFSNTTLSNTTLEFEGIAGQLSGTLVAGTYKVGGHIEVANGKTLIIEPGVTLLFNQDVEFNINGLLIAEGTETDSIKFTRYNDSITWGGIDFNEGADDNSILSYCLVEYSNSSGISIKETSPTLNHLLIQNNSGGTYYNVYCGGGICLYKSNSTLTNLLVRNNTCDYGGGILFRGWSSPGTFTPIITNSLIINNTSPHGGGVYLMDNNGHAILKNTIIVNNLGDGMICNNGILENLTIANNTGMGIHFYYSNGVSLSNSIVSGNNSHGISCTGNIPSITYINSWGNNSGNFNNCGIWIGLNVTTNANGDSCDVYSNIQLDPLFVDTTNGYYHLKAGNPCIDAGTNNSVTSSTDFYGSVRIWDGDSNGTAIVDMGPYEFGSGFVFNLGADFYVCSGDSAVLDAGNGYLSYDWNNGLASTQTLTVKTTGAYFVKVTNIYGISNIDTINVTVLSSPSINLGSDTSIYDTQSITLSAGSGFVDYTWSDNSKNSTLTIDASTFGIGSHSINVIVIDSNGCSTSDTIIITIIPALYDLSGKVYAGTLGLQSGIALLFDIGTSYFNPVAYDLVSNTGEYEFMDFPSGQYLVYAIPNPFVQSSYFPTYHVNKLGWWYANKVDLLGDTYSVDINLIPIPPFKMAASGEGNISGDITYEDNTVYEENIYEQDWFTSGSGTVSMAARNMPVLLYNESGAAKKWTLSDKNGHFEFNDIPYGIYTVHVEKAGFKLITTDIDINENNPTRDDVEVFIGKQYIAVSIGEDNNTVLPGNTLNVYPNPVNDNLSIKLFLKTSEDINLTIYNSLGQNLYSTTYHGSKGNNIFQVNVDEYEAGMYFGRIQIIDRIVDFKFIK